MEANLTDERELLRYEAVCSVCGHKFYTVKSIAQEYFKMPNCGHGSCPKCDTFLNLTFDAEKNVMITMPWEDYIKTRG